MNDLMSLGLHRYWKSHFVRQVCLKPFSEVLDLAAGTGDISFLINEFGKNLSPHITLCDQSAKMLSEAKSKKIDRNIRGNFSFQDGPAESLPFEDNTFDVCTVSFGFRNFSNQTKALEEILRVLKPGGQFLCLEFSQVGAEIYPYYNIYLSEFIPRLGRFITNNEEAYTYLKDSIKNFHDAETLKTMLEKTGFKHVAYEPLTKGIVAIHKGWK